MFSCASYFFVACLECSHFKFQVTESLNFPLDGRRGRYTGWRSSRSAQPEWKLRSGIWVFGRVSKLYWQVSPLDQLVLKRAGELDRSIKRFRRWHRSRDRSTVLAKLHMTWAMQLLPFFQIAYTGAWRETTALSATMHHLLSRALQQDPGSWDVIGVRTGCSSSWRCWRSSKNQMKSSMLSRQRHKGTGTHVLCAKLCWMTGFQGMVTLARFQGKAQAQISHRIDRAAARRSGFQFRDV